MCDVAYGETQSIIKSVLFIVILEVVKSWQGKGQRNSSWNIPRPQLVTNLGEVQ